MHGLKKKHHTGITYFLNHARNSRCTVITDLNTLKWSTQKAFACCDAILQTGPAISMRSELLLVGHKKLGHFPNLISTFETAPFFCVCPALKCIL
jgi:hypothetical protein